MLADQGDAAEAEQLIREVAVVQASLSTVATANPPLRRSARICFTRSIGAIGGRCIGTVGLVYPGTLFHRRQRGIPYAFL